jgi:hypothetical protein
VGEPVTSISLAPPSGTSTAAITVHIFEHFKLPKEVPKMPKDVQVAELGGARLE